MLKSLLGDRKLLILLFLAIALRLFAFDPSWVEKYYSLSFYPVISQILRILLGWIPFSIGDILYLTASVFLISKVWKVFALLFKKRLLQHLKWPLLWKYLRLVLWIYIIFMLFWGLNYYRQGISKQLGLDVKPYSTEDLVAATMLVEGRLNSYADQVDSLERNKYLTNRILFDSGAAAYAKVAKTYSFLAYKHLSTKASIFSSVGHYFGFTGYCNPFTAEAQVNTTVPVFLRQFIISHEIGHQLGYAKENEASFVGYLTCKSSGNIYFKYSVYYELFRDLYFQCRQLHNPIFTRSIIIMLHPRVIKDNRELRAYLLRKQNIVEPFINGVYDKYLRMNNQPHGITTYDEVVALLIAYLKKYGIAEL